MKSNRIAANGLLASVITVLFVHCPAQATLIKTGGDYTNGNEQAYAATVSSTDLINQGTSTFLSATQTNYTPVSNSGVTAGEADVVLNDGSNGPTTVPGQPVSPGGAFDVDGAFTVTYNLNLASAPLGYDLTQIVSYAAHVDNRVAQQYTVLVTYVGGGLNDWVSLGTFTGAGGSGNAGQASRVTLENDLNPGVAAFATGVDAIEFTTALPASTGYSTVYREFDVEGMASTVPEPSTWALLVVGASLLGLTLKRRPTWQT